MNLLDAEHKRKIIETMRNQGSYYNPSCLKIGTIVSVQPLQVDCNNTPLNRNRLRINKHLLDWTETIESTTSTQNEHNHTITTIKHKSCLAVGDSVLLYEIQKNKLYALIEVME